MILVDTSVWIEHFRHGHPDLVRLLENGDVATHPMVLGELACGQLPKRASTLHLLGCLPRIAAATDETVFSAIERRGWFGVGIGWIDAHLLTAALLSGTALWTRDERLRKVARSAHISHT
ncbi:MAG: type II toxin-antitoxin system VapC family toxin [Acidobacteriota bacterium]